MKLLLVRLLLFSPPWTSAINTFDDVFTLPQEYGPEEHKTPLPGACNGHETHRLRYMFPQMQEAQHLGRTTPMSDKSTKGGDISRTFLGIRNGLSGEAAMFENNKRHTVRKRLKPSEDFLYELPSGKKSFNLAPVQLICDSTFMQPIQPDDALPPGLYGAKGGKRKLREWTYYDPDSWWFFIPHVGDGGRLWSMPKKGEKDEPFPSYKNVDDPKWATWPTYCAKRDSYAWSINLKIQLDNGKSRIQWIMILCPNFFNVQKSLNINEHQIGSPFLDRLPEIPQHVGTFLDYLRPTWLTWYEEILKIVGHTETLQNVQWYKLNRVSATEQSHFTRQVSFASDAFQCISIAMYCLVSTQERQLAQCEPLSSVANFAWYVVANFLQEKTGQDWSSGMIQPPINPLALADPGGEDTTGEIQPLGQGNRGKGKQKQGAVAPLQGYPQPLLPVNQPGAPGAAGAVYWPPGFEPGGYTAESPRSPRIPIVPADELMFDPELYHLTPDEEMTDADAPADDDDNDGNDPDFDGLTQASAPAIDDDGDDDSGTDRDAPGSPVEDLAENLVESFKTVKDPFGSTGKSWATRPSTTEGISTANSTRW